MTGILRAEKNYMITQDYSSKYCILIFLTNNLGRMDVL